jgi:type I site-specific restriction endonuclease
MSAEAAAKLERLLAMSERLAAAITADIAALESGRPRDMKTIEPETQKLSALYERELSGFSPKEAAAVPTELRAKCAAAAKQLNDCLQRQQRLLKRMKTISEGMIRAVAQEVQRQQSAFRPYSPKPVPASRSAGAMVYNNVV